LSRNVRKPTKGSKDSDYYLLPIKTSVKKLAPTVDTQGPITLAKMPKPIPLTMSPTKKRNPKLSNFKKI